MYNLYSETCLIWNLYKLESCINIPGNLYKYNPCLFQTIVIVQLEGYPI